MMQRDSFKPHRVVEPLRPSRTKSTFTGGTWLVACGSVVLAILLSGCIRLNGAGTEFGRDGLGVFARSNLVAWCIVPFDAKKRDPEARAAMLEGVGIKHFAYDYRAEHIPLFDAEIDACRKHGVSIDAWWFPTQMNDEARMILSVLKRKGLSPQLWVMGGGGPTETEAARAARIEEEVKRLKPICEAAAAIGSKVGLYNHGSWFGEPENQILLIERLRRDGVTNVGIVYNLHHGHEHLGRFDRLMKAMKPYLITLNLNGMTRDGEKLGRKIMPLGQGDLDLELLAQIRDSGWRGPIGILNHTDEDAEARLRDNIDGLEWLVGRLRGTVAATEPRPQPKSWRKPQL